jgi:hypothetical protein
MTLGAASARAGSRAPSGSSVRGRDSRSGRSGGPRRAHSGQRRSCLRRRAPSASEARPRSRRAGNPRRPHGSTMLLQQLAQGHVGLGHRGLLGSWLKPTNSTISRRPRWPPRLHRRRGAKVHHVRGRYPRPRSRRGVPAESHACRKPRGDGPAGDISIKRRNHVDTFRSSNCDDSKRPAMRPGPATRRLRLAPSCAARGDK